MDAEVDNVENFTWYYCYLLFSNDNKKTYVGATTCVPRRLRQHNGEITGGAKRTRSYRPWTIAAFVKVGEKRKSLQLEWKLKRAKGPKKRLELFKNLCEENNLIPIVYAQISTLDGTISFAQ